MKQRELNRAIASATGESMETIGRMGFSLVEVPNDFDADELRGPYVVDWDELETRRHAA